MKKKLSISIFLVLCLLVSIIFLMIKNAENNAQKVVNEALKITPQTQKEYLTVFGIDQIHSTKSIHQIWAGKSTENSLKFNIDLKEILSNKVVYKTDLTFIRGNSKVANLKIESEVIINKKPNEYELTLSYSYENGNEIQQIIILDKSEIEKL